MNGYGLNVPFLFQTRYILAEVCTVYYCRQYNAIIVGLVNSEGWWGVRVDQYCGTYPAVSLEEDLVKKHLDSQKPNKIIITVEVFCFQDD